MDYFRLSMRLISLGLSAYALLIFVRIILSWIHFDTSGFLRTQAFFQKLTDPYLNLFRGFGWLRIGMWDFSPAFATVVLYFAIFIASNLANGIFPTVFHVLIWILVNLLGLAAFICFATALTLIVRLVAMMVVKGSNPDWVDRLDRTIFPLVSRFLGYFTNRPVKYSISLGIMSAVLIILRFLLVYGTRYLGTYLYSLLA